MSMYSASTCDGTTVWPIWVAINDQTGAGCTSSGTTTDTWQRWATATSNTTTSAVTDVWPQWVAVGGSGGFGSGVQIVPAWGPWIQKQEETEQAKAERLERERVERERQLEVQRAMQQKWKAEQKEREIAEAKAKQLLEDHLNEGQKAEIKKFGHFTVISRTSQRKYRIDTKGGSAGNIKELDAAGKAVNSLCCHPRESLPVHDAFLTQMLWLMWCEDGFRKTANISRCAA